MWTSQNARAPIAHGAVSTRRYLHVGLLVLFLGGCAGGLAGRAVQSCPSSIPAPVLEVGDTWNIQEEGGRNLYRRYVRRTDDGLFEREDRPGGAQMFYDDAHTLRKVFREGRWNTEASLDYPDIGKPKLAFPLQVGWTWSDQVIARSVGIGNVIYHRTYTVLGCEQVTVPGGTFFAVVIEETQRPVGFSGGSRTWWYAPDAKNFVKLVHRPTAFWSAQRDWSLTSYRLASEPGKRPQGTGAVAAGIPTDTSVPIEIAEKMIFVAVEINGFPPMPFILDTGASFTLLKPAMAQRLGVSVPPNAPTVDLKVVGGRTVSVPLARVKTVKVGQLIVEDMDLGIFESFPDVPELAGLLGGDFLDHFSVSVDRQARRLTLSVSSDPDKSESTETTLPVTISCPKGAVWTGKGCIAEEKGGPRP